MALVTTSEMLGRAQKEGYAVGAFNVENMEMVKAVIAGAEELKAPVILQTTPSTVTYGGLEMFVAMTGALAKKAEVPIALHLDHGNSFALAVQALREGYTSIMIDGSALPFQENIQLTKRVVETAAPNGIPVEAELGKVGGKEDDTEARGDSNTDPDQALEFQEKTGISSLAVAIGTAHGFYQGVPVLDKDRLQDIRNKVRVPLVLHGASGLTKEEIQACIRRGICKVNFATELRVAYTDAVKAALEKDPGIYDPKPLGKMGIRAVKDAVKERIKVCGCEGKTR